MRTRALGKTGIQVPAIGQGTWQLRDARAAEEALLEGLRLGMVHVDTAELYEWGSGSETLLGGLLSKPGEDGRPWREHCVLASKVHPRNGAAKAVASACKDSLVRLQTDRLDLYYHHWRGGQAPLEETLQALAGLVDAGWVRAIGVSNYDVEDLEEAQAVLGRGRIAANQVLYHLEDRGAEAEVSPWCRRHGVTLVAYSPFGSGAFVRSGRAAAELDAVASEAGCTPRQAALAFLVREPHVVAIPKAEKVAHVRENAGGDLKLRKEHVERIDAAFPVRGGLRTI
ncbi:MAG TPA: aldo/keto reductase [Candidatus Thermoplasmatota archaeon]|nr:aldo/keto reductase [Candidatus Thermoplasmatota archaeon]